MSRKSNTLERRAEITAAMLRVLAEQGYERATIQAIAKEAQLTPGLIHYHFKSKSEILMALIEGLTAIFESRFHTLLAKAKTPKERLQSYVDARLAKGDGENPEAVAAWVIIGSEAVKQAEVQVAYAAAIAKEFKLIKQLLEARLAEEGKHTAAAHGLAAIVLASMEGSFQLASAAESVMPKRYAASNVMKMIERFILHEEDAA